MSHIISVGIAYQNCRTLKRSDLSCCSLAAVVSLDKYLWRNIGQAVLDQEALCNCSWLISHLISSTDIFHLWLAEEQSNISRMHFRGTLWHRTVHPMWLFWPNPYWLQLRSSWKEGPCWLRTRKARRMYLNVRIQVISSCNPLSYAIYYSANKPFTQLICRLTMSAPGDRLPEK